MTEQENGTDGKIVDFGKRWKAKHPDGSLPAETVPATDKATNDFMDYLEQKGVPIVKAMDRCDDLLYSRQMYGVDRPDFKDSTADLATQTLAQLAQELMRLGSEEIYAYPEYVTVLCQTFKRAFYDELAVYVQPHPDQPTDSSVGKDERIHL